MLLNEGYRSAKAGETSQVQENLKLLVCYMISVTVFHAVAKPPCKCRCAFTVAVYKDVSREKCKMTESVE